MNINSQGGEIYAPLDEQNSYPIKAKTTPSSKFGLCFFCFIILGIVALVAFLLLNLSPPGPPAYVFNPYTSIHEAILSFQNREVSCVDFISSYLKRIEDLDRNGSRPLTAIISVNTSRDFEKAIARARAIDEQHLETGQLVGKLHCIPIVAKDSYSHADFPTTGGSALLRDCFPTDTDQVLRQLESQGAVLLGKANMPDFTVGDSSTGVVQSNSTIRGPTVNAYAPLRSPYGSSGGTGAAIAAGLAVIGLGADTQGSIQMPSACEGLVGVRPTQGLVSAVGDIPLVSAEQTQLL
jgi:Asp-tRNA(Asn)/Glu-tRNA(Gln) amidotransferase A subunit family amidase